MNAPIKLLPLTQTVTPDSVVELADAVRLAYDGDVPVYPIGGGTSLDYGLPAKTPGVGLSLQNLDHVLDYPARDMTITVEPGITMTALAETLARQGQRLPIDAPRADHATLGGTIATNASGPRRFGQGTIRDYVIGISAVDGMGRPFKGGGRVVKNVAGYDFCKLLTGSLGTLGVITQVTLKVKPRPEASAFVACDVSDFDAAERLLAALVTSQTTPTAVELLTGPDWLGDRDRSRVAARLIVGLEGTAAEIAWMARTLDDEWQTQGIASRETIDGDAATQLWSRLTEYPAQGGSPLVIQANVRPSAVTAFIRLVREIDERASIQAHAGSGIVVVRFSELPAGFFSRQLVGRLHPAAALAGGHAAILSSLATAELTRQSVWGASGGAVELMRSVKKQFDPRDVLNRGRFVY